MRKLLMTFYCLSILCFSGAAWALQPYLADLCNDAKYTCIKVHKGEKWQTLFADPELRSIVMKLNRVNVQPKPGQIIVVPNDMMNVKLMDLAPFDRQIQPPGQKTIIVDPALHAWGAYDKDGQLVNWGPASGGRDWCADISSKCHTVTGEFTIFRKHGAGCASSKFPLPDGGAPMPYCMFFHRGYAIHASNEVPGYHASHGCVRVPLEDARWLNQEFIDMPRDGGTKVIVKDYPQSTET